MSVQINLLPKTGLADSTLGKLLKFSLTYGRYIIVGTQLIVLLAFFSRFKLDRELTDLQDSVEQKYEIVKSLSGFEKEVRLVQSRIEQIKILKDNHDIIRNSLESVKSILPTGVYLTKFNIKSNLISLDGVSQSEQNLSKLINRVNSSEYFSSANFDKINKRKEGEGIEFSIKLTLETEKKK